MPADPLIGTTLAGRYRLEAEVGRGGMSTVYRAFDTVLERLVAIKVLHTEYSRDPSFLERFRREARAGAQLSHPNVVTVIDAGEDDGHPYIVFDYVDGENLKQRLRRVSPLPIAEAIAFAIEMGQALSAAHAAGLIHRDVKPQNVLVDAESRARVTDFGIARLLGTEGLTQTGRVLGTTDYVSPEQALGREVTGQADVYSLGVVLFEMLTGSPPFAGDTHVSVAMKHVRDTLPDVQRLRPEVSAALAAIVDRATAKHVDDRYASANEMIDDLEEVLAFELARSGEDDAEEVTTVLRSLPDAALRRRLPLASRRRRRVWLALGAIVAIALVVAVIVASKTSDRGGRDGAESPAVSALPLPSKAAADYDPSPGDDLEHTSKLQTVVDGNPQTFWDTEVYKLQDFGNKRGVGLLIKAGRPVSATAISIRSPERLSGFQAEIYGANPPLPASIDDPGWSQLARSQTITGKQRIPLDNRGRRFSYYLIWITRLAGDGPYQAGISEIKLLG